jgi:serine protease Do
MDLALLKSDLQDVPPVVLGDSSQVKVGEWVVAIGNPFGLHHSVTTGIISAKERHTGSLSSGYEGFLQTDAAINPGNSGGPLVNLKGEVIGINTAIVSSTGTYEGIGFAIPINTAKEQMKKLMRGGRVKRGYLGVALIEVDQTLINYIQREYGRLAGRIETMDDLLKLLGLEKPQGAFVAQVVRGTPAWRYGIGMGDVIVRYNGKVVDNVTTLRRLVAGTEPGTKVTITVVRSRKRRVLQVVIGELPARWGR